MTQWLPSALFSLMSFGLWGFFTKLAIVHVDSKSALIFQTAGVLLVGLYTLSLIHYRPTYDMKGLGYGLLTGVAYGIGCLFYFVAAGRGKIINVVMLTALYPLVTILLSYFLLRETITLKQCIGIGFAVLAILLMAE